MQETNNIDLSVLNALIYGRVEPHIYAFTTETIPNYLKVGDTYRPIEKRLNEWRKFFPNLDKKFSDVAKTDNETFFRDLSIHRFLENDLHKKRLKPNTFPLIPYYSNEFFQNTGIEDVKSAIIDINSSFAKNDSRYQFYKFDESRVPIVHKYARTLFYEPRPNQKATIGKFKKALANGRTNLLMYAVMRFGKSFTALCCAKEMDASIVVVVSAKADVKEEWKKTTESIILFDGYEFMDSNELLTSDKVISDRIAEGKKLVIFLTLQDLQGDQIKTKHKEIFENQIDLLLIDESHFGARAEEYGKVLNLSKTELKNQLKVGDTSIEELEEPIKLLDAKIRIHLSGTPYRILMGSEFTDEDIIAFYQFTDIANDQKEWDDEHLNEDDTKEWDNPYYGFPQMIRFAFNPNQSSIQIMEELKSKGITYAFSALFAPLSIIKDSKNKKHQIFENENEVLDLLKIIDGSQQDNNLLGFLDYDKIKDGSMCRHMVCVLPYRASCDALEVLITKHKESFKNLGAYEIINIAGVENEKKYSDTTYVKNKIIDCESKSIKTITLTVNRMLTGSTVEQWDTMLYFKDTSSPQEYDQAIFRIQNQYIKEYKDENEDVIKYNMKPQTLLVDFDPTRMFRMQEEKSKIYNVNTESNGNSELEDRIKKELEISPIITLNHNKMVQVKPSDILDAVRQYSNDRSVLDEATVIPIDYSLLNNPALKAEIEKQNEIGSRQGLELKAVKTDGEGDDLEIGESDSNEDGNADKTNPNSKEDLTEKDENSIKKKFATYYSRILFFAFLTDSKVISLKEIMATMNASEDNKRLSTNLDLKYDILDIINSQINPFILSKLDYKIQNINTLTNDKSLAPIDRAGNAMRKFTRLSDSEVVTPMKVADEMVNIFPAGAIDKDTKILDIASKQGEFVYAIIKKYGKDVAANFYAIPTSKITYEFTRKVYKLLELDIEHIERRYNSYDLLNQSKDILIKEGLKLNGEEMKFDVVIGNPPYQKMDGGAQASAKPIYQDFLTFSKRLNPRYLSLIIPSRWYAGGRGLDQFRNEMLEDKSIEIFHDFLNPESLFPGTNIRGGLCYFLMNSNYNNSKDLTEVITHKLNTDSISVRRSLKTDSSETFIRFNQAIAIIDKVKSVDVLSNYVSSLRPFGFRGYFTKDPKFRAIKNGLVKPIICYGKGRKIGYVEYDEIKFKQDWVSKYKVFTPRANNIATELNDDNLNTFIGKPNTICTESFIVIGAELDLDISSARNLCKYLSTKFSRFLHSLAKSSQDATSKTYKFIPLQDFTKKSDIDWAVAIKNIDLQLYKKYNLTNDEIDFIEKSIKLMN